MTPAVEGEPLAATGLAGAFAGAPLLAAGFALVHPTLIGWAVSLRAAGPGTAVGLLATLFFCGQAATTQGLASRVERAPRDALLLLAGLGALFAVLAALLRNAHERSMTEVRAATRHAADPDRGAG